MDSESRSEIALPCRFGSSWASNFPRFFIHKGSLIGYDEMRIKLAMKGSTSTINAKMKINRSRVQEWCRYKAKSVKNEGGVTLPSPASTSFSASNFCKNIQFILILEYSQMKNNFSSRRVQKSSSF